MPIYILIALIALYASPVHAQGAAPTVDEPPPNTETMLNMLQAKTKERFVADNMKTFRQVAGPDQVMTQTDVDDYHARIEANWRAQFLAAVFLHDLNADGAVTEREMNRSLDLAWFRGTRRPSLTRDKSDPRTGQREIERYLTYDQNKDGRVTLSETYQGISRRTKTQSEDRRKTNTPARFFEADADKNDRITLAEIEDYLNKSFAAYDDDGDGFLSPNERPDLERIKKQFRQHRKSLIQQLEKGPSR